MNIPERLKAKELLKVRNGNSTVLPLIHNFYGLIRNSTANYGLAKANGLDFLTTEAKEDLFLCIKLPPASGRCYCSAQISHFKFMNDSVKLIYRRYSVGTGASWARYSRARGCFQPLKSRDMKLETQQ